MESHYLFQRKRLRSLASYSRVPFPVIIMRICVCGYAYCCSCTLRSVLRTVSFPCIRPQTFSVMHELILDWRVRGHADSKGAWLVSATTYILLLLLQNFFYSRPKGGHRPRCPFPPWIRHWSDIYNFERVYNTASEKCRLLVPGCDTEIFAGGGTSLN